MKKRETVPAAEETYRYEEFFFHSAAKGQKIFTRRYLPTTPPRAVVQIVHGMAEHSALYGEFCVFLAENGYLAVLDDHLGHGRSVAAGGDFGYFFEGGMENLLLDEKKLHDLTAEQFPGLPYFLMGHSMGSFLVREMAARWGNEYSGAVIMGTAAGKKPAEWLAQKALLSVLIAKHGPRARVEWVSDLAVREYRRQFPASESAWVTGDSEQLQRYEKDPMCGFGLTLSAYRSMGELLQSINSPEWYRRVPKGLPLLLLSGAEDPVGGMGLGVRRVAAALAKTEHNSELILYRGIRHALVNERNRQQVFRDIEAFLSTKTLRAARKAPQQEKEN